tara:strand:+ start:7824 stop:9059 length:1236 start_codon:yes stop_codon:yes gene_type:complete
MKVLIVNASDISGGAARAANRLHRALLNQGIESQMLVQSKTGNLQSVVTGDKPLEKACGRVRPFLDSLPAKRYEQKTKTLFSPAWVPSEIVRRINEINPDIVHFHWINSGMLPVKDIPKIKAPIVWSLHDMWAFTGGCHYDENCGLFRTTCGSCPVLGSTKSRDLSYWIQKKKEKAFSSKSDLYFIGLSNWMANAASESRLLQGKTVLALPNPIDTGFFSKVEKDIARDLLGLPQDSRLVLFGAMNATGDPRKGFAELSGALNLLEDEQVELVVFGASGDSQDNDFKQKVHFLGQLNDDLSLKILYSAADVMVVPSLQENLSNAIMESMSCGTPVVAFAIGGNGDMIDHLETGYLASPFDIKDLARGIEWVLNQGVKEGAGKRAAESVRDRFDSRLVANQYIEMYTEILSK